MEEKATFVLQRASSAQSRLMRVIIVVPTIREKHIRDFLTAWQTELTSACILVVEDNPTRTFDLGDYPNVTHYAWEDIDRDLGQNSWIIPRHTDCIRSYGIYKAYQERPDLIITLDDDCYPENSQTNFIQQHWARIQSGGRDEAWCLTGEGVITRGVPYFVRSRQWPCVINHGLWTEVPDYDAPTQLLQIRNPREFVPINQTIPVGKYFPMCGSNLAFRPQVVPALYFLLMGPSYPYDRFGDIWCGIVIKKICDHLGYAIKSGSPCVVHRRASNIWDNLRKEAPGMQMNEELWIAVDRIVLHGSSFGECYAEVARQLDLSGEYWTKVKEAMLVWASLFDAT
jgi:reversibly glycosylated polypeptide/UDP-arabinopyranose mutase